MVNDPSELILEHLRAIRQDIGGLKADIRDLKDGLMSLRDDVHSLRGDLRRQERALATVEVDIDRIKARLDLSTP
jgi:septal ring factor EnvC (AmiA/AmiB activator)